jgi:hypothetical protein
MASTRRRLATSTLILFFIALAGVTSAEEPGAAAVEAARAALAKVAAAAQTPTKATETLGPDFLGFAQLPPFPQPVHGQSIDSAAQPFFHDLRPRLDHLRERILDRRHRFLTGESRPLARKPELLNAVFDLRSLGPWRGDDVAPGPWLPSLGDDTHLESSAIGYDVEKLKELVDTKATLDEGGITEITNGALLVRGTKENLERTRELLDYLRSTCGRRLSVDVAAYEIARDVWREHASQKTPADAERVLARAISEQKATLLALKNAVVEDGCVAHLTGTRCVRFIDEVSVNQTGVVPVFNAHIGRVDLGLRGDVRARFLPDGAEATVDLDVGLVDLRSLKKEPVADHELGLPETATTRCATTLDVPLGVTVMAGGTFAGSEAGATPCVFAVRVTPYGPATGRRPSRPLPKTFTPPEPTRPELAEVDALLALVEDAIVKLEEATRYDIVVFDIRDVCSGPHVRVAPPLGIQVRPDRSKSGGGMAGATLTFGDDRRGVGFEGPIAIEPDKLEQIVKNSLGADSAWGDPASYDLHRGEVIINQTPGEIAGIGSLMSFLRRDRVGNVELEAEWLRLEDGLVTELTRAGGSLSKEDLVRLDALAAAGERASRVASGFVVAQRGDLAVIQGAIERSYVSTFETSSGGTNAVCEVVTVPIVGISREGVTLEALGHGDALAGEGALSLDARVALGRITDMAKGHTPGGTVTVPVMDEAHAAFNGLMPGGGLLLVVGRRTGEKRPALGVVLRGRLLGGAK